MKVQRLTRDNIELSTLVRSGEPTVLFVHGLAGYGGEWAAVVNHLDEAIGIIAPDQRAHGASFAKKDVTVDRDSYVADLAALVEEFAQDPVVVVGQSMGGVVATLLAQAHPDLVRSLVLVECGMAVIQASQLDDLDRWLRSWPSAFTEEDEAIRFFGTNAAPARAWVDGLKSTKGGLVPRWDRQQLMDTMISLTRQDRWSEWQDITTPCTLVRAATSSIDDIDVERMLQLRPETNLVLVPDCGHDVHLDQPRAVAAVLSHLCCESI